MRSVDKQINPRMFETITFTRYVNGVPEFWWTIVEIANQAHDLVVIE